ncbi:NUDIX hydrolase [Phaeobacter sp. J2-8]|uniref:NUDIX hydrolase n=1 Tax=Phaeobacter sp. J2-8 TaxID=2931394 RepID=UPI001FCFD912|nr:NUDIX hydrolase [Phaeobacter sp. J2-8]MCJ7871817.1 NUDIX hydrolase [Phaeobacter sp. J2-8]
MSYHEKSQLPLAIRPHQKEEIRAQFAALCFRIVNNRTQVLLITSRGRKRWIIPKGWPSHGVTPAQGAAIEAWEEAGVMGRAYNQCVGVYSYMKLSARSGDLPCVAMVYPIRVKRMHDNFPEAGQRRMKWMPPASAAALVSEPELKHILLHFDPRRLRL